MNTALRTWATPLTAGLFIIMAVTGGLMFFHLDTGLNKAAHEWLGWGMLAAATAHLGLHWRSLQRQLTLSRPAQFAVALSLLLLAGSFYRGQGAEGASPPGLAIQAIARAPLTSVAPLTGKSLAQVQRELAGMGLDAANAERSLNELAGRDRARIGQAVRTLFAPVP